MKKYKSSDIYCKKCKGVVDLNALHGITDEQFLKCDRCKGSGIELKVFCDMNQLNYAVYKARENLC